MIDNRTASAIDLALQKHHTPVGDLYAAIRHGRMKRCFSRGTAISWLAHFLTSHSFARSGFKQRHLIFWLSRTMANRYGTAAKPPMNIIAPTSAPFADCAGFWPASAKCRSGAKGGMPCTTAT